MKRVRDGKGKEWVECLGSDVLAFGIPCDWKVMALEAGVWNETDEGGVEGVWVREGNRRKTRQESKKGAIAPETLLPHPGCRTLEAAPPDVAGYYYTRENPIRTQHGARPSKYLSM